MQCCLEVTTLWYVISFDKSLCYSQVSVNFLLFFTILSGMHLNSFRLVAVFVLSHKEITSLCLHNT